MTAQKTAQGLAGFFRFDAKVAGTFLVAARSSVPEEVEVCCEGGRVSLREASAGWEMAVTSAQAQTVRRLIRTGRARAVDVWADVLAGTAPAPALGGAPLLRVAILSGIERSTQTGGTVAIKYE